MAPIAASITVHFTANYTGQHRICWRIGSVGAYDCSIVIATTTGTSYDVVVPVIVDNESCSDVTFEGYVQATCEDIASTTGRIPFSVVFTPSPTCLPINVLCQTVGIESFTITNPGSGYVGAPTVTLSAGTGTGTAVVGVGAPTATLLFNIGAGLTPGTYLAEPATAIVGVGVGATFDVTVTGAGVISSAVHNAGTGSGYVAGDSVNFPGIPGSATEQVDITAVDTGTIVDITVGVPGSYSVVPGVTIDPPPGFPGPGLTTATATAVLGRCPDGWMSGDNCLGDTYTAYPIEVGLGLSFNMCNVGAVDPGTIPANYLVTAADPTTECCYECVDITITYNNPGGDPVDYAYIDCNPVNLTFRNFATGTITDGNSVTLNCVVKDSWTFSDAAGISVVEAASSC